MKPLAVIGNVNVDLIMGPAAPWPQPGTEIIVDHDELRVGGSAGNAALAWMALGMRAVFLPDAYRVLEQGEVWNLGGAAIALGIWLVVGLVLARVTFRWTRRDA